MSRNVALPRQVKEDAVFQEIVIAKMQKDDFEDYGPFTRTSLIKTNYAAQPWEIVEYDPSSGTLAFQLPDPSRGDVKDAWIGVKNQTDSGAALTVTSLAGAKIDGAASAIVVGPRAFQFFFAASSEWQKGPSGSRAEGYPSGAPVVLTFPLTAGSADALVFTVPAAPPGAGRFTLQRVEVRLSTALGVSDTGSVLVRVGTTSGGNDIGTDQMVDKTTPAGLIFSGLSIATRGSAMLVANGYELSMAAGAQIFARATTTGTITKGDCTLYVYGAFHP